MNTTFEAKKQKAIEYLKELGVYKPYIKGFEKDNQVCFYERFAGYWVGQEPEIEKKMKEIEKKYDCVVYAITHELMEFGEYYSFLLVTDYEEEWDDLIYDTGINTRGAFAYVWNKDFEYFSGFGSVGIRSLGGGIARISYKELKLMINTKELLPILTANTVSI